MTKRALLYGRVSQDVQRDNYSIPTQIALCLRHAQEQGYGVVGAQYIDQTTGRDCPAGLGAVPAYVDDHSGTELLRPSVLTMLEYLRTVGADVVIVLSIDRLARDPYIRQTLEREIEATGARVIYVQGNYAESPEGEIHKDLDGAFAKWENLKRVERSLRGKKAKAERGLFVVGAAPYGYELDKSAPGGLAVNPEEAQTVRRIFELCARGESIRSIARGLTAVGIPAARFTAWTSATIHVILRNETYSGRASYNRRRSIITGDGITQAKRRKAIEREPGEVITFAVTPLVDQAIFDQAQRRLDDNRAAKRRQTTRFYLLSGMVFCAACGRRYTVQTEGARKGRAREGRQYRHRQSDGHCRNHMLSAAILEPPVWAGIARVLQEPAQLAEGYEAARAEQVKIQAHAREHLQTLRRNLGRLDNRQAGLVRIYADGDIIRQEYLAQRAEIDRERAELTAKVKEQEACFAEAPTVEELAELQAVAEDIRHMIESGRLTEEMKRGVLEDLAVRVEIGADGKATVKGVFKPFEIRMLSKSC